MALSNADVRTYIRASAARKFDSGSASLPASAFSR